MNNERISLKLTDGYEFTDRMGVYHSTPPYGLCLNTILHSDIADKIEDLMRIRDEFHCMSREGMRWIGAYRIDVGDKDIDWCIVAMNGYDGSTVAEIHSGFCVPAMHNAMSFNHSESNILVNESLSVCREHFNAELDRMEAFKKIKLTKDESSGILCDLFISEIISATRSGNDLIRKWHNGAFNYCKPRTLWSLFVLCSWYLNDLAPAVMISRTKQLHDFFDKKAQFKPIPSKYTQTRFA